MFLLGTTSAVCTATASRYRDRKKSLDLLCQCLSHASPGPWALQFKACTCPL